MHEQRGDERKAEWTTQCACVRERVLERLAETLFSQNLYPVARHAFCLEDESSLRQSPQ